MKPITIQFRQVPDRRYGCKPSDPLYRWEASGEAHTGFGKTMEAALKDWLETYPAKVNRERPWSVSTSKPRVPEGIFDI